jgi:hypothetical protein
MIVKLDIKNRIPVIFGVAELFKVVVGKVLYFLFATEYLVEEIDEDIFGIGRAKKSF